MNYALKTTLQGDFANICEKTRAALAEQGFGVLTEIDFQGTIKKKLDKDIKPYVILGACHPASAYESFQAEANIGLLLPCNVTVRTLDNGDIEVAAIDPSAMMAPVNNPALEKVSADVRQRFEAMMKQLQS